MIFHDIPWYPYRLAGSIPPCAGSLDFVLQLRAEEGMDTVLQSLVLLLGEAEGDKMTSCSGDVMGI